MSTLTLKNSQPIQIPDRLTLNKSEAAKMIGCSEKHLERAANRKEFPVVRLGRRWFVTPEALRTWLNQFVR